MEFNLSIQVYLTFQSLPKNFLNTIAKKEIKIKRIIIRIYIYIYTKNF